MSESGTYKVPRPDASESAKLAHLGATAQHPTGEEGVVRVGFEGDDVIGDVGEGVGKEPNVCTDVDGNPAAWHQLGKNREFGLARACLFRDSSN